MATTFSGQLACPVEFGQIFVISGKSLCTADRINVNLAADKFHGIIPFHLSIRFGEHVVVRNNKTGPNFIYEQEERSPGFNGMMNPFVPGEEFKIYIFVGTDRFHIGLDNQAFGEFMFRAPLSQISVIQVYEDVEFIYQVDHRRAYPSPYPPLQFHLPGMTFSNDLPIPYRIGHVVVVKGIAQGNAQGQFTIRFLVGHTEKQALHFNVRFPAGVVVRNHTVNNNAEFNYDEEERHGGFPFQIHRTFKIAFGFGHVGFRIAVNGKFFCDYSYKGQWNTFTGIKCSGKDGMTVHITEVDHHTRDSSLCNFEELSSF
uniref:Galectin n=2 Tax=Lutzomyia longipalpis TaxID=7200 RepID=A0A1B0CYC0_LUTLO